MYQEGQDLPLARARVQGPSGVGPAHCDEERFGACAQRRVACAIEQAHERRGTPAPFYNRRAGKVGLGEQRPVLGRMRVRGSPIPRALLENDREHVRAPEAPGLGRRAKPRCETACLVEPLANDAQAEPHRAEHLHLPPDLPVQIKARRHIARQLLLAPEARGVARSLGVDEQRNLQRRPETRTRTPEALNGAMLANERMQPPRIGAAERLVGCSDEDRVYEVAFGSYALDERGPGTPRADALEAESLVLAKRSVDCLDCDPARPTLKRPVVRFGTPPPSYETRAVDSGVSEPEATACKAPHGPQCSWRNRPVGSAVQVRRARRSESDASLLAQDCRVDRGRRTLTARTARKVSCGSWRTPNLRTSRDEICRDRRRIL